MTPVATNLALPSTDYEPPKHSGVRALDVRHARALLEGPVFGDAQCIAAVRLLAMLEECRIPRFDVRFTRYVYPCPCCKATGSSLCDECGNEGSCHRCKGEGVIRESETEWLTPMRSK